MPVERRVGVDTSVVVNFLTGGAGDNLARREHSTWVFDAEDSGVHRLVVPALVLAAVAGHPESRGSHLAKRERHRRIAVVRDWFNEGA